MKKIKPNSAIREDESIRQGDSILSNNVNIAEAFNTCFVSIGTDFANHIPANPVSLPDRTNCNLNLHSPMTDEVE